MKLYYHKAPAGNFGDDLSPWLFSLFIPNLPDLADDQHCIFGVGTILTEGNLSKFLKPIIFGSGGTYKTVPSRAVLERCNFICVRGPLTRDLFGLPKDLPLCDPAIYIPKLLEPAMISDTKKTVFVPHHLTVVGELGSEISNAVEQALDIEIVSPREDFRVVIDSIRSAELVLTESLHGAIIADAFRIPWRAVALSPMFNWFKWRDWSYSVEIEPEIYAAFGATNLASRWLGKLKRRVNFPRNLDLDWRKDRLLSRNQVCDEIVRVLQTAMRASPQMSPQWAVEARMDDFEKAIREFRHRYNG